MNHTEKIKPYQAYLLRFWEEDDVYKKWRFSLEDVSGEHPRKGFNSFEDMVIFLRGQLEDEAHRKID